MRACLPHAHKVTMKDVLLKESKMSLRPSAASPSKPFVGNNALRLRQVLAVGYGPPADGAPSVVEYKFSRDDARKFLKKLQKVNGTYMHKDVYNDVFAFLTGSNIAWDSQGIERAIERLGKFDAMLRRFNLIRVMDDALMEADWYKYPYITETMYVILLHVEEDLAHRTRK